jgi:hypothetical protein
MPESLNQENSRPGAPMPPGKARYSSFSLNYIPTAAGKEKYPNWRGQATVIDDSDGSEHRYEVAAWGPKTAESGIEYFDLRFAPTGDPIERARQERNRTEVGPVRNKPRGFELTEIGLGKLFELKKEPEGTAPKSNGADGKPRAPARLSGFTLLRLPSGDTYVKLSLWDREGGVSKGKRYSPFLSGSADIHDEDAAEAARAAKAARIEPSPQ